MLDPSSTSDRRLTSSTDSPTSSPRTPSSPHFLNTGTAHIGHYHDVGGNQYNEYRDSGDQGHLRHNASTIIVTVHGDQKNVYVKQSINRSAADRLKPFAVAEAAWNSAARSPADECFGETRAQIRKTIFDWAKGTNSQKKIYWLTGSFGIGKSCIAQSLASACVPPGNLNEDILGGSFFFSMYDDRRNDARKLFTTMAYQLCCTSQHQDGRVQKALKADASIPDQEPFSQFRKLIKETIPVSNCRRPVVIIDGLDEGGSDGVLERILGVLLKSIETPLRLIITSQMTPVIREFLDTHSEHVHITDLDKQHEASEDIRTFYLARFSKIQSSDKDPWISNEEIDLLVKLSGGLFLFADVVVKHIRHGRSRRPRQLLEDVLTLDISVMPEIRDRLEEIYRRILSQIPTHDYESTHRLLATVCLTSFSFTVSDLDTLHGLASGDAWHLLQHLHPFLYVPGTSSDEQAHCVRLTHRFFREFILDSGRSKEHVIDPKAHHGYLATRCLITLTQSLRRNMCNLPSEGPRKNPQISQELWNREKTRDVISGALEYAARFWCQNFVLGNDDPSSEALTTLRRFCTRSVLHWIESMSLLFSTKDAIQIMQASFPYVELLDDPTIKQRIIQVTKLTQANCDRISAWPLTIYDLDLKERVEDPSDPFGDTPASSGESIPTITSPHSPPLGGEVVPSDNAPQPPGSTRSPHPRTHEDSPLGETGESIPLGTDSPGRSMSPLPYGEDHDDTPTVNEPPLSESTSSSKGASPSSQTDSQPFTAHKPAPHEFKPESHPPSHSRKPPFSSPATGLQGDPFDETPKSTSPFPNPIPTSDADSPNNDKNFAPTPGASPNEDTPQFAKSPRSPPLTIKGKSPNDRGSASKTAKTANSDSDPFPQPQAPGHGGAAPPYGATQRPVPTETAPERPPRSGSSDARSNPRPEGASHHPPGSTETSKGNRPPLSKEPSLEGGSPILDVIEASKTAQTSTPTSSPQISSSQQGVPKRSTKGQSPDTGSSRTSPEVAKPPQGSPSSLKSTIKGQSSDNKRSTQGSETANESAAPPRPQTQGRAPKTHPQPLPSITSFQPNPGTVSSDPRPTSTPRSEVTSPHPLSSFKPPVEAEKSQTPRSKAPFSEGGSPTLDLGGTSKTPVRSFEAPTSPRQTSSSHQRVRQRSTKGRTTEFSTNTDTTPASVPLTSNNHTGPKFFESDHQVPSSATPSHRPRGSSYPVRDADEASDSESEVAPSPEMYALDVEPTGNEAHNGQNVLLPDEGRPLTLAKAETLAPHLRTASSRATKPTEPAHYEKLEVLQSPLGSLGMPSPKISREELDAKLPYATSPVGNAGNPPSLDQIPGTGTSEEVQMSSSRSVTPVSSSESEPSTASSPSSPLHHPLQVPPTETASSTGWQQQSASDLGLSPVSQATGLDDLTDSSSGSISSTPSNSPVDDETHLPSLPPLNIGIGRQPLPFSQEIHNRAVKTFDHTPSFLHDLLRRLGMGTPSTQFKGRCSRCSERVGDIVVCRIPNRGQDRNEGAVIICQSCLEETPVKEIPWKHNVFHWVNRQQADEEGHIPNLQVMKPVCNLPAHHHEIQAHAQWQLCVSSECPQLSRTGSHNLCDHCKILSDQHHFQQIKDCVFIHCVVPGPTISQLPSQPPAMQRELSTTSYTSSAPASSFPATPFDTPFESDIIGVPSPGPALYSPRDLALASAGGILDNVQDDVSLPPGKHLDQEFSTTPQRSASNRTSGDSVTARRTNLPRLET